MQLWVFFTLTLVCAALAIPPTLSTKRDVADTDVLNFALTLEHLEANFYKQGLAKYSQLAFIRAGSPAWARERLKQIAEHEQSHVDFLTDAIKAAGMAPVQACEYSFPHYNVKSFIDMAEVLESVGTSAYNGVAKLLKNKAYITAGASILSTEARHAAFLNAAVRMRNPWSTPYETPLDLNQVYTLASSFIKRCPSTNAKLPAKAYPLLYMPSSAIPGARVEIRIKSKTPMSDAPLFGVFLSGMTPTYVPIERIEKKLFVEIPDDLKGTVYVTVSSENGSVEEGKVVAGPAILMFGFDSGGYLGTR